MQCGMLELFCPIHQSSSCLHNGGLRIGHGRGTSTLDVDKCQEPGLSPPGSLENQSLNIYQLTAVYVIFLRSHDATGLDKV